MGPVACAPGGRLAGLNEALAREVVERLWQAGVRTFVVCPGGRDAPLVESLEGVGREAAEVVHFFDERSAAFFALGRTKRDRCPAAVVTTSGTAAAELLPAMIEAYYEGERLIAVTADRPARFRGTGAPQAIDQRGLFGSHVVRSIDLDRAGTDWSLAGVPGTVHVNVCFEEPLLDGWQGTPLLLSPAGSSAGHTPLPEGMDRPAAVRVQGREGCTEVVRTFLRAHRRPLVVLGALQDPTDQEGVRDFCLALGAPVLAEASSHMWGRVEPLILHGREASAQALVDAGRVGSILRIGDVPSFRVWRDLEERTEIPVLSVSRRRWPGLTRGECIQAEPDRRLPLPREVPTTTWSPEETHEIVASDRERGERMAALLAEYPASEPALVARLSRAIPRGSSVYLGNSLPIREWNQFAALEDRAFTMRESRGVNGIDGQVSTFLGTAEPDCENWAVVGDLTALYDLSAPWALRYLEGITVRIVVVNNGGGRIFGRLFANKNFQNLHETGFEGWATLWSIPWMSDTRAPDDEPAAIIEVRPSAAQTEAFWAAWGARRSY
ncbi:MAG: 2-succinyl-5-enolpyruvyl-6-hydroxy-3-cyclohexene-1-carboxylic-acid synthase [Acidobacteriota bacterium]